MLSASKWQKASTCNFSIVTFFHLVASFDLSSCDFYALDLSGFSEEIPHMTSHRRRLHLWPDSNNLFIFHCRCTRNDHSENAVWRDQQTSGSSDLWVGLWGPPFPIARLTWILVPALWCSIYFMAITLRPDVGRINQITWAATLRNSFARSSVCPSTALHISAASVLMELHHH